MTDHPSTYKAKKTIRSSVEWDDRAALHRADDGEGVFDGGKALRRGTFAEMINYLVLLPEDERSKYLIEKAGDREYSAHEAIELSQRADFPAR